MRLAEQSDSEVFEAMRSGDLCALDVFYDRYGDSIYRLGLRILHSKEEAADLAHDVFLALWRDVTYDPSRGSLIALLTVMTRSRAINRLRQAKSQQRLAQRWGHNTMTVAPENYHFLEHLSLEETSQQVRAALQQIPEKQRQVLELAYYDGLSHTEITERLGIPLGTVKTWTRRGLLKLRQQLQNVVEY